MASKRIQKELQARSCKAHHLFFGSLSARSLSAGPAARPADIMQRGSIG